MSVCKATLHNPNQWADSDETWLTGAIGDRGSGCAHLSFVAKDPFVAMQLAKRITTIFGSPEHKVLKVSFCDRLLSVVRHSSSIFRCLSFVVIKSLEAAFLA